MLELYRCTGSWVTQQAKFGQAQPQCRRHGPFRQIFQNSCWGPLGPEKDGEVVLRSLSPSQVAEARQTSPASKGAGQVENDQLGPKIYSTAAGSGGPAPSGMVVD